jgi:hypothetical protein
MLVAGPELRSAYLAQQLFQEITEKEPRGSFKPWAIEQALERENGSADLTVIRIDSISARLFFRRDYLHVPAWVAIRCRPAEVRTLARGSKSVREDLRCIRHAGLSTEIKQGDFNFDHFYDRMYIPLMQRRHGDEAYIRDSRSCQRLMRHGGMIWALRDGQRVGGCVFERRGKILDLCVIGLLDGDPKLAQQGAISALYIRAIEQARLEGCEWVNFGLVRPSLTDGLLRYKAKWGGTICDPALNPYSFLVRWERWNPAIQSLLSETPLVYTDSGRFAAMAVLDHPDRASQEDTERIHRRLWVNGLTGLTIVSPSGWQSGFTPPPDTRLALPGPPGLQGCQPKTR